MVRRVSRQWTLALTLLGGVVLVAPHALAASHRDVQHRYSVTVAPLLLFVTTVEATGEYRLRDKLGASATLGFGRRSFPSDETATAVEVPATLFEVGSQARYYIMGTFIHGLEVGVEGLYRYAKFDEPLPFGVVGMAAGGLTAGAFLGYKIATNLGFTFEAQFGERYRLLDPVVTGSTDGDVGTRPSSRWRVFLRANVGWSF